MNKFDNEILQKYYDGKYLTPVTIFKTEKIGYGVKAILPIPKNYFICEYAGDVVPMSYPKKDKDYAFQLSYGPKSDQEFEICPIRHWSLGNYINHGSEK